MSRADDRIARVLARLGVEHEPPAGWEGRVLAAIVGPPERRWWFAVQPPWGHRAVVRRP